MSAGLVNVAGDAGCESGAAANPEYELIVTLPGRDRRNSRENKKSRKK